MVISSRADSCSAMARASGEPLFGTTPTSQAWVLLEQPGSWASDPMATDQIAGPVADFLTQASKEFGFRTLLVRRSAARPHTEQRRCFLVNGTEKGGWIRAITLSQPFEVTELDLGLLRHRDPPDLGEPCPSIYTVCTHGRRDPCCAEHGRRVVNKLLELRDPAVSDRVWESSHLGGHRFAANLACFPSGTFYGSLTSDEVGPVVRAHELGRLSLPHYRGRACYSQPAQAADYLLRKELGLDRLADLELQEEKPIGADLFEFVFAAGNDQHRVLLEVTMGPERRESCNKDKLSPLKQFRLLSASPAP